MQRVLKPFFLKKKKHTKSLFTTVGSQHLDEDDNDTTWLQRPKHFIVLTHAGKPVFSRFGDENRLSRSTAIIQALISYVGVQGDTLQHLTIDNGRSDLS